MPYDLYLSCRNQCINFPRHREQIPHNLIIPKADDRQPHLAQNLFPPGIFLLLQVMDIPIYFNNQPCLVTVKVDNKTRNDLLPSEMNA